MSEYVIIIQSEIVIKVDEEAYPCPTFKAAIESGLAKVDKVNLRLVAENGTTCEDEKLIKDVKEALIYGLMEKG